MTEAGDGVEFVTGDDDAGRRLDVVLVARVPGMSRKKARALVERGGVRVEGRRARKGERLAAGVRVTLDEAPPPTDAGALPDPELASRLVVVHEDPHLVVVDKPGGVPSHPLRPDEIGTVASALVARYPEMAGVGYVAREPGIVHRLDTGTSGLLLAARDEETFAELRRALVEGAIEKRYVALVVGAIDAPLTIDAPIASGRHGARRVRVLPSGALDGKDARTRVLHAETIASGDRCLVEVEAPTARRHQIRAHLASIGHPLVGDILYGGPEQAGFARHFLHASAVALTHPHTRAPLHVESALPSDLERVLSEARSRG